MWLQLADGSSLPVHGVNRPAKDGECVIYNTAFGPQTPVYPSRPELLLQEGVVIGRGFGGTPLWPGLVVVAGDPPEQLRTLELQEPCRLMWELHLPESDAIIPGEEVWFVLGGGPRLVTGARSRSLRMRSVFDRMYLGAVRARPSVSPVTEPCFSSRWTDDNRASAWV